jgi:membrane protease subunit HflK
MTRMRPRQEGKPFIADSLTFSSSHSKEDYLMDRRPSYGDGSPTDELLQTIEGLRQQWRQRFPRQGIGLWIVGAFLVLLWLGSGFYVVGPGERGIVLLFGAATDQTEPGLRYRLPWPIQSHAVVDIAQVRRAEVGFRTAADSTMERGARGSARTVPQEA